MRKYFLAITLLSIFITPIFSQNLIPDPGFELWDGTVGSPPNTMAPLDHWYNANGTPDHHHQQNPPGSNLTSLEPCPAGNGQTQCGFPYQGEGVLGCWKGNGDDGTREWAGTQLTEPMVAGDCYKVSFWVQSKEDNPNFFMATNQWGLFFSTTQTVSFSPNVADYSTMADQWVACEQVIEDSIWRYFEFDYVASDNHQYVYVGYMGNVSNSTFQAWSSSFSIGFYAWFDEISVEKITPTLTVSEDEAICPGDSVLLSFDSNFPILWTDGTIVDSSTSVWVTPQQATTYYVQTQDSTQCTVIDSVVISILTGSTVVYPEMVCVSSDAFILDASIGAGTWVGTGVVDTFSGLFDPSEAGVGQFEIAFISDVDCSENFLMSIEVEVDPIVDFEAVPTAGCEPLSVQFTDLSSPNAITYLWDFGNGQYSTEASPFHLFQEQGSYDISLEVNWSPKCIASITQENLVQASEVPVADFSFTPEEPSIGDLINFQDISIGNTTQWFWSFGDGSISNDPNPSHQYEFPETYIVSLVTESAGGCADSISYSVVVENKINFFVPNVFTPNGDGTNDLFEVFIEGLIIDYKITIFNRWGGVVFQSTDPEISWDGFENGDQSSSGVYVYLIEYTFPSSSLENLDKLIIKGDVLTLR